MRSFASDNYAGVVPEVMKYLNEINNNFDRAYGDDQETEKAKALIKKEFGKDDIEIFFMFNGTGSNTGVIRHLLKPYEAVICAKTSHLNCDESSAPIVMGAPLMATDTTRVTVEDIETLSFRQGDLHSVQAKMVSIASLDEMGEVYSKEELRNLSVAAKSKGMYLYVDGARIGNALASLNLTMKEYITDSGVDCINMGLTKVGAMMAEALVFVNGDLGKKFGYTQKSMTQLISKMRFTSGQFIPMLENGLYLKLAKHSNEMAKLLESELKSVKYLKITNRVDGNMIFVEADKKERLVKVAEKMPFYTFDKDEKLARFVTSFETTKKDIKDFVELLKAQ